MAMVAASSVWVSKVVCRCSLPFQVLREQSSVEALEVGRRHSPLDAETPGDPGPGLWAHSSAFSQETPYQPYAPTVL